MNAARRASASPAEPGRDSRLCQFVSSGEPPLEGDAELVTLCQFGRPGARLGACAYKRATLAAYFRTRVRMHERIRLVELRARYDPSRKIVNFSGKLVRSADDLHPRLHDFKGAADGVSGDPTLIVWSM